MEQQLEWESTFRHLHKLAGAETKDLGNKLDYNLHSRPVSLSFSLSRSVCLLFSWLIWGDVFPAPKSETKGQRGNSPAKPIFDATISISLSLSWSRSLVCVVHVATTQFGCLKRCCELTAPLPYLAQCPAPLPAPLPAPFLLPPPVRLPLPCEAHNLMSCASHYTTF